MNPFRLTILIALLATILGRGQAFAAAASPPGQPATGPGGAAAAYPAVIATQYGDAPTGYWLFEPTADGQSPTAGTQPLIVFLHGHRALDPAAYRAWIDHIVRRGAVVVYPFYQGGDDPVRPNAYLRNVVRAVRDAVETLSGSRHTPVDIAQTAVVGHSLGGMLTANYAAVAAEMEVPVPAAIMPVEPGGCRDCSPGRWAYGPELADLGEIAAGTLALVVVGSDDDLAGQDTARVIWDRMTAVPFANRDYVLVQTDTHGRPALRANHYFPATSDGTAMVNALDWYGTWRLFDALTACAFTGTDCDQALGGGPAQRAMGTWSDGTPVAPLIVTDDPTAL